MTSELRQAIREARDAHLRVVVFAEVAELIGVCGHCGCPRDCYSPGCSTCWHRRHGKKPLTAEQKVKANECRQRRRAARKASNAR